MKIGDGVRGAVVKVVREFREEEAKAALRAALEHVDAASTERNRMPALAEDPRGHAKCVLSMHAHMKAADTFLETYRNCQPLDATGDGPPLPAPEPVTPARASAAVLLLQAGKTAAADRLLGTRPRK